ncbi:MAG: class I SAM-dependent methyltransferase [Chlorobiaceae bacterium]
MKWFEEWFNHPFYLQVYSHRDHDEAAACIQTIISLTGLNVSVSSPRSALDIACGAGRHALELARLGCTVTANDLSPFLLEEARREADALGLSLTFTCHDMRAVFYQERFDLVVQLFTSFGYFEDRNDDRLVLQNAHAALKKGGWYALDLINPDHLLRNLVARSERTSGDLRVLEERTIQGDRVRKSITIASPSGEEVAFTESVRIYGKEEILEMLADAGFTVKTIAGNYKGEPFTSKSPRMMLICRKS